jgi:hypothetical protein
MASAAPPPREPLPWSVAWTEPSLFGSAGMLWVISQWPFLSLALFGRASMSASSLSAKCASAIACTSSSVMPGFGHTVVSSCPGVCVSLVILRACPGDISARASATLLASIPLPSLAPAAPHFSGPHLLPLVAPRCRIPSLSGSHAPVPADCRSTPTTTHSRSLRGILFGRFLLSPP